MKILFLASTFRPTIGGAETYALNIVHCLSEIGHSIEIVTDEVAGELKFERLNENARIHRLHHYRHSFTRKGSIFWEEMQFALRPELKTIADACKPDIVFSNSLDLCYTAKLISLYNDIPWLATFHEQAPEREPFGKETLALGYRIFDPDGIIAGSKFYLARAKKYGRPEKSYLIYHGVDTKNFADQRSATDVRSHYKIPESNALILSLGRFKERKGFMDLLDAIGILKGEGILVSLVIAGSVNSASTEYLTQLKQRCQELEIEAFVNFETSIPHEKVPWLISGSDIVVQPSLEEGLGLAVIESMACQRPVIVSKIPGHNEITDTDDVASLVDANAPTQIAEAISNLLENESRRLSMGISARNHVIKNFSFESMAKKTSDLMISLIERRGNASA